MTIQELVAARAPFDAEMPAVRENGNRQLDEAWKTLPKGTWLAWCASRAGVEHQKLLSALCACADWAKEQLPPVDGDPFASLEAAREWSRSGKGQEKAVEAGWELADRADASARASESAVQTALLWALADLLLTVRSPLRAPQAVSGFSQALAAAGKSEDQAEEALAGLLRQKISWGDIEAGLASPTVKPSSLEEELRARTVSRSERTIQSMDRLLKQAAELQQQFDNNLQEVGLSRKAVRKVMEGDLLDEISRGVVRATIEGMEDAARSAEPKKSGGGRKPRLRI